MTALLVALLALPPCAVDAAAGTSVECKLRVDLGEPAPFAGVLLTDALALGVAQDMATLEAAAEARGATIAEVRAQRDACAERAAHLAAAGDALAEAVERQPSAWWWWVGAGVAGAVIGALAGAAF